MKALPELPEQCWADFEGELVQIVDVSMKRSGKFDGTQADLEETVNNLNDMIGVTQEQSDIMLQIAIGEAKLDGEEAE